MPSFAAAGWLAEGRLRDHQYGYATTRAVSLAQEAFDHLCKHHLECLVGQLDLPED